MLYARVEYDAFEPWTYYGIVVTDENQKTIKSFRSESFDEDFRLYHEWAESSNQEIVQTNSMENFVWDRFSRESP